MPKTVSVKLTVAEARELWNVASGDNGSYYDGFPRYPSSRARTFDRAISKLASALNETSALAKNSGTL